MADGTEELSPGSFDRELITGWLQGYLWTTGMTAALPPTTGMGVPPLNEVQRLDLNPGE